MIGGELLCAVLCLELVLIHAEILYALYETDDAGNAAPACEQAGYAFAGFAEIEIVGSDSSKKNA